MILLLKERKENMKDFEKLKELYNETAEYENRIQEVEKEIEELNNRKIEDYVRKIQEDFFYASVLKVSDIKFTVKSKLDPEKTSDIHVFQLFEDDRRGAINFDSNKSLVPNFNDAKRFVNEFDIDDILDTFEEAVALKLKENLDNAKIRFQNLKAQLNNSLLQEGE